MSIKVMLGDCIEKMRDIPDGSVDCVAADIPYGEVKQKSSGLRKLDRGNADTCNFDIVFFAQECARISSGSIYIFCGIGQISAIDNALRNDCGLTTRLCQWEKTNPSPMNGTRLWLSGSEFCVFARKPKAYFGRKCEKPIWSFPVGRSKEHPTEKPVALMEYIIESSCPVGGTVADFTMGSGTTGVAAKNLGRSFIGIELDVTYYAMACRRIGVMPC